MVKKVKRFVIFILFSFFYSLFAGKNAEASAKVSLVPKSGNKVIYNKKLLDINPNTVADSICY